jgi:hypothetical protein
MIWSTLNPLPSARNSLRDVAPIVIARSANCAAAIQPFDRLTTLSGAEGRDCFVVSQSGTPRNDRIRGLALGRRGIVRTFALLCGIVGLSAPIVRAEVLIERIFMPHDASPSSFAIGLPGGVNFCFDPVRGGVSYAWKGGFVDLTPARPGTGKFITAVKLLGPLVYQETGIAPLRRGDPSHVPTVEFTGYALRDDAIEFRYTIDGAAVREEIRASADGMALVRRFHVEGGGDSKWWHVTDGKPATELKREREGTFVLELPLGKAAR